MFYRENNRFLKKSSGRYFLFILALIVVVCKSFSQTTYTFNYTGSSQTLAVQPGNYEIECWGANGGNGGGTITILGSGGKGGYSKGIYSITSPTVFYIYVGGQGQSNNVSNVATSISVAGGWNGGGGGFTGSPSGPLLYKGGGGGGSDVRMTQNTVYANRIIVAGGGGGSGGAGVTNYIGLGGNGGAALGQDGILGTSQINHNGKGGTQIAGGAGGTMGSNIGVAGVLGVGGNGGSVSGNTFPAGGGGGGWYGGGGGATQGGGGGGGSSYISGLINGTTAMFGQTGFAPNPDTTGNGFVKIINLCPVVLNSIANPICIGKTTTLSTNAISNYSWSTGAATQSIVVSPTTTTNYSVSGTGTILTTLGTATCTGHSMLTITVNPLPSLTPSTLNNTICAGQTASLVVGGNPSTFTWQPGGQTGLFVTVSPTTTTIYTVTGTDANGCENTANVTQSVVVATTLALSPSNQSVCSGSTVSISGTGAATYTWQPGGFLGNTFTTTLNSPTFYTVTGTSSLGCVGSAIASVTILPVPALSFITASITCASLGSATVNATGGTGPYSYTWAPTAQTNSAAVGLNPGTYTLTVFDAGTGCTSTATTIFNSLIPLTGTLNSTSSLTCPAATNGTAHFSNFAGGSGNENYIWTNGISSYTVANPQNLSAGQWSVNVMDALTSCPIFSVFTITEPPPFSLSLSSANYSSCVGAGVVLSGTNSGGTAGYTYTWTNGPPIDTYTVNEITSGTYVYTLSSSDANNCLTSNTISVNFVPNPTLSVSDVSICPLQTGTLTVSGATSYTWASATLSLTGTSFADSPAATQQYSVTGSALGCTSMATASIVLKPTPFATLIDNSPLCEGASLNLTAYGGVSYVWDGTNGFSSSAQANTLSPVALNQAGVYNVTVTAANSCTASTSKTIVVNPNPTVSATGATICTSQTLNLSANSNAVTFSWSGPQSFTSSLQNPSIASPLLGHTGTYSVKATSAFGCTIGGITTASVVDPPSLTVALSSNSLCSQAFNGSPNTITLTAGGASIYSLVTVPDMSISNPNGPVSQLSAIPPNTGITSATLSGSNGVCTVTTGLTFSIIPNPTVTINSPTPVICAGETYTYTNQGANSYTWTSATPGFTTYNNGGVAVANPSINSVFSVFGGSLGCNSASQTSSITVNPLPTLSVGPQNPTVCIGSQVVLTAGGTANSYSWAPYATANSDNGSIVIVNPSTQQTYTVTGSLNSCTSTAMITVSIVSLPSPTIQVLKPAVCLNEAVTMHGFGGERYYWFGPSVFFEEGQIITFTAGVLFYGGTYTLTVTDKNNCRASTTTSITVYNLPNGNLQGKMEGCVPLHSEFNFEASPEVEVVWELNHKTITTKNFNNDFTTPGTYTITGRYTDTLTQCKNTNSFVINAYPLPIADFSFLPEKPIENLDQVIFTNTSTGEEQTNWNWYFINNKGFISENKNTSYLFTEAGTYPVAMVVTNSWGCKDTLVKALKIEADLGVYVPNVFTPNDDGLNDVFLPITRAIKFYELLIFDRWGEMVFTSADIQRGWDGTYRGEPCKVDVYVWRINLSSVNGEMKTMTGQVTLSR